MHSDSVQSGIQLAKLSPREKDNPTLTSTSVHAVRSWVYVRADHELSYCSRVYRCMYASQSMNVVFRVGGEEA
jgi:hypothetical protein